MHEGKQPHQEELLGRPLRPALRLLRLPAVQQQQGPGVLQTLRPRRGPLPLPPGPRPLRHRGPPPYDFDAWARAAGCPCLAQNCGGGDDMLFTNSLRNYEQICLHALTL